MSDAAYSGVVMPIYQGVSGSRHVLAVDWHIEVELPDGRRFGISIKKGNTVLKEALDSVLSEMTAEDFNNLMAEAIAVQPIEE